MLRFLVLTSLAALGKNSQILSLLTKHSAHIPLTHLTTQSLTFSCFLCFCFDKCWLGWSPSPGTWRLTVLRRELWEERWPDPTPGPGRYSTLLFYSTAVAADIANILTLVKVYSNIIILLSDYACHICLK